MSSTSTVLVQGPEVSHFSPENNSTKRLRSVIWYLINDPKFDKEKPYYSNIPFEHPEAKQTNLESAPEPVEVSDIRGSETNFELEKDGFQVIRNHHTLEYDQFSDPYWIQAHYYPIVEEWVKSTIGSEKIEKIYIYDHTVRRRNPDLSEESRGVEGALQPVPAAHVDHSHGSGPTRVRVHLKEEDAEFLMANRYQIVNIWQPLFGPIQDWPLAVCDPHSVTPNDLVPTDLIYPHYFGEIYSLKASAAHRWYYLSNQTPAEVFFFKSFDSDTSSTTRFVPHCGMANPEAPRNARPRESIEFRSLIFYKNA